MTAAQTNITSVGTLSSLTVSGDATFDTNTLFVDSSANNVGIGTTTPDKYFYNSSATGGSFTSTDRILAIHGGTSGQNNGVARLVLACDANHTASIFAKHTGSGNTHMGFLTTDGTAAPVERMRINEEGKVGIGTTSPDYKLHVNAGTSGSNTVAFNGIGLVLAGSGGNNGSIGMLFNIREPDGTTSGSGAKAGIFGKDYAGTWNRSSLVFCTNNETNTNDTSISDAKMVIRETGNVGIGDTNPGAKLEIRGTDDTGESYVEDILRLSGKYNYQNAKYGLSWYNEYNQFVMGAIRMQSGSFTNSPKMFFYNSKNQATPTIKMTIDCDGNVGIGETSPSKPLHIKHSGGTAIRIETTQGDVNGAENSIEWYDSTGQKAFVGDASGGNKTFHIWNNRGHVFVGGSSTTNVGIGNQTPSYKLDVSGDINFTGTLRKNGTEYGGGGSSAWTTSGSDIHRSSGKVGIGTSSLGNFKLHIYDSTGTNTSGSNSWHNHLCLEETSVAGSGITFKAGTKTGYIYYGSSSGSPWVGSGSFGFATTATANSSDIKMVIKNDGKVGIGTLSPQAKLDVTDSGSEGKIQINNDTLALLQLRQPTSNKVVNLEIGRTSGEFSVRNNSGEKIRMKENGNVGIGT